MRHALLRSSSARARSFNIFLKVPPAMSPRMARDHGVQPLFGMSPDFVAAFSLTTELATEVAQFAC